jgi:hypothetical protein
MGYSFDRATGCAVHPDKRSNADNECPGGYTRAANAIDASARVTAALGLRPRARLIRLPSPPPRAQLIRLPESRDGLTQLSQEHIDETHTIQMPYGEIVRATLRGFLEQENQLPRVGRMGDMYVVGNVPWIWVTVPGTASPTWVDP